jgi:hypothetical protein
VNNLLHQQLEALLANTPSRAALKFESALRVGAGTQCRGEWSQITATTVVCEVPPDEIEAFRSLVEEIAEEYGLDASIRQNPGSYSVRFTCPSEAAAREGR